MTVPDACRSCSRLCYNLEFVIDAGVCDSSPNLKAEVCHRIGVDAECEHDSVCRKFVLQKKSDACALYGCSAGDQVLLAHCHHALCVCEGSQKLA